MQNERRLNGGAGREAGGLIISDVEPWIRACQGYRSVYALAQSGGLASHVCSGISGARSSITEFEMIWSATHGSDLCRECVARATSRRVSRKRASRPQFDMVGVPETGSSDTKSGSMGFPLSNPHRETAVGYQGVFEQKWLLVLLLPLPSLSVCLSLSLASLYYITRIVKGSSR